MANVAERIFFTVHNDAERNPHSVVVIEALKRLGCAAVVMTRPTQFEFLTNHGEAVALVDFPVSGRLNHWRPEMLCDQGETSWARRLATRWMAKISHRCVSSEARIDRVARQLSQTKLPWGSARSTKRRRSKTRPSRTSVW